jgi:hypothetical protein
MMLPDLSDWDETRTALHQSMQVLRSTRLLGVSPLPNDLHYGTIPIASGATTGPLSFGGALRLDFTRTAIIYERQDHVEAFVLGLQGYNQTSLFEAVFDAFEQVGHRLDPNRSKVTHTTPFEPDTAQAKTYAQVMWRMFGILAHLKARMVGPQTPIVLWPHGFDLSTIWFVDGMEERYDPHINFGFSPGTPDVGQPYFYFYAWPVPEGFSNQLPSLAEWHTDWGTPGGLIKYERFARESDPETVVAEALVEAYQAASNLLKAAVSG